MSNRAQRSFRAAWRARAAAESPAHLLVDEVLQRAGANLAQVGDAEHKADGVEHV